MPARSKVRLTCLIAAGYFLIAGCRRGAPPAPAPDGVEQPAQVLQSFSMQDLKNGLKTMVLIANEGRLFEKEKYADLDQPNVTFFEENKLTSTMVSPSGRVYTETKALEAWGGVTVNTADGVKLTTARLRYDPVRELLISDERVRIERGGTVTEGQGLEATRNLQRIKIGRQTAKIATKDAKKVTP